MCSADIGIDSDEDIVINNNADIILQRSSVHFVPFNVKSYCRNYNIFGEHTCNNCIICNGCNNYMVFN